MSEESHSREAPRRPWRLMVGLLIVVGGFYLMLNSMVEGGTYFLTVDEAMAAAPPERPVRIKGNVAEGTYKNPEGTLHTFDIKDPKGARTLTVRYDGPLPDVFSEGREVVAEGRLGHDGVLVATEVTAKCPSKYEEGRMSEEAKEKAGLKPGS